MIIILKIAGGIGNQLFQYSFGQGVAKKFNAELLIDLSAFENYSYPQKFELEKLITDLKYNKKESLSDENGTYFLNESLEITLESFNNLPKDCKTLVVSGYWQDEKYIDAEVVTYLYEKLKNKYEKITTIFEKYDERNLLAVHIRRREYGHMGLCSEEYYIGAIEALICNNPDLNILLFSDEPNYSLYFLNTKFNGRINLIKNDDDLHDLYIMSKCKHIIISNSTYSWWGAYFNESNKKTIINPSPWLSINDTTKPCPLRWISIPSALKNNELDYSKILEIKNNVIKILNK